MQATARRIVFKRFSLLIVAPGARFAITARAFNFFSRTF
jgi:hypothetical protein